MCKVFLYCYCLDYNYGLSVQIRDRIDQPLDTFSLHRAKNIPQYSGNSINNFVRGTYLERRFILNN